MIEVRDLEFSYQKNSEKPLIAISDWVIETGSQVFLYGPSGSGKSTVLNLLSGLLIPDSGHVQIQNQNLVSMKPSKRDQFRAKHIGFIHQQFNLIPYLSVNENLKLAMYFAKQTNKERTETFDNTVKYFFEKLKLPERILGEKPTQLSVGQQQRIAIARAFINSPNIIIADEPTSALDSNAKSGFISLLQEIVKEAGSTLVFVSHDFSFADEFTQRVDLQTLNTGTGGHYDS